MIRRATVISFAMALIAGTALFVVKHEVQTLEEELAEITRATLTEQEAIHVLKAEWSYLNEPARLQRLAEKHLDLEALTAWRLVDLDALPWGGERDLVAGLVRDLAAADGADGAPTDGGRLAGAFPTPPPLPDARSRLTVRAGPPIGGTSR